MGTILQSTVIIKKRSEECKKSMNTDTGLIQTYFYQSKQKTGIHLKKEKENNHGFF